MKGWPGVRISGTVSAAERRLKALEDVRKMTPERGWQTDSEMLGYKTAEQCGRMLGQVE